MRTASVILALALGASASTASAQSNVEAREQRAAARLAAEFAAFAGSEDNALALVLALRTGESARLADEAGPDFVVIAPPPGSREWAEVKRALTQARDELRHAGIARPSGEQLVAALTGGDVQRPDGLAVRLRGVLPPGP